MNNTITGALEFFAFLTIIAAGIFLWFATPAHALTCYTYQNTYGGYTTQCN